MKLIHIGKKWKDKTPKLYKYKQKWYNKYNYFYSTQRVDKLGGYNLRCNYKGGYKMMFGSMQLKYWEKEARKVHTIVATNFLKSKCEKAMKEGLKCIEIPEVGREETEDRRPLTEKDIDDFSRDEFCKINGIKYDFFSFKGKSVTAILTWN